MMLAYCCSNGSNDHHNDQKNRPVFSTKMEHRKKCSFNRAECFYARVPINIFFGIFIKLMFFLTYCLRSQQRLTHLIRIFRAK